MASIIASQSHGCSWQHDSLSVSVFLFLVSVCGDHCSAFFRLITWTTKRDVGSQSSPWWMGHPRWSPHHVKLSHLEVLQLSFVLCSFPSMTACIHLPLAIIPCELQGSFHAVGWDYIVCYSEVKEKTRQASDKLFTSTPKLTLTTWDSVVDKLQRYSWDVFAVLLQKVVDRFVIFSLFLFVLVGCSCLTVMFILDTCQTLNSCRLRSKASLQDWLFFSGISSLILMSKLDFCFSCVTLSDDHFFSVSEVIFFLIISVCFFRTVYGDHDVVFAQKKYFHAWAQIWRDAHSGVKEQRSWAACISTCCMFTQIRSAVQQLRMTHAIKTRFEVRDIYESSLHQTEHLIHI